MISTLASHALRPTILEVDLDAAAANMRAIRELVGPDRKIFAVVKADGYGYGAAEVAAVFLEHGADALAVADLSTTCVIAIQELKPPKNFAEVAPFPVTAPMQVGVIPIGSADGLKWLNAGRVLVRGRPVSIVAKPSLEHTRIDLTDVPEARIGDEVVIIGRQGDAEITVAEVVERHGLGLNQVATTVGPRVTRKYLDAPNSAAFSK